MGKWLNVHVGFENDGLIVEGAKVWQDVWRRTEEPAVRLPHPSYPNQLHDFSIIEVGSADRPIRLAVAELSNGVWGFYRRSH